MKPLTHVTDPHMVKALAHPLRVQILDELEDGMASATELARRIGAPLTNTAYHVRKLEALGVLKVVKEVRRRGAIETYFEVQTRPSVRGDAWEGTPEIVKQAFLDAMLGNISRQVNAAAAGGGFSSDAHVSRLPLRLDDKGFRDLAAAYEKLVERAGEIEESSRARLAKVDHEGERRSLAVLMLFDDTAVDHAGTAGNARSPKPKRDSKHATSSRS